MVFQAKLNLKKKEEKFSLPKWESTILSNSNLQWVSNKPNTGEDVEQEELLFIAGEKEKWYSLFERQEGSSLQN